MNSALKYIIFTIIFLTLGAVSYTLGQKKGQDVSPIYSHTYEYQTTSFDPNGDKNEQALGQKDDDEIKNTIIKPTYILASDDTIARQNKRELCAFNFRTTNRQWTNFINLVNQNCNHDNIDICWQYL